jgi:hypothetical protein
VIWNNADTTIERAKGSCVATSENLPPHGKKTAVAAGANTACNPPNENMAVTRKSHGRETERQQSADARTAKISGKKIRMTSSGSFTTEP